MEALAARPAHDDELVVAYIEVDDGADLVRLDHAVGRLGRREDAQANARTAGEGVGQSSVRDKARLQTLRALCTAAAEALADDSPNLGAHLAENVDAEAAHSLIGMGQSEAERRCPFVFDSRENLRPRRLPGDLVGET